MLRSNAALRPPPIEPEVGVTHAAGGHFSRWHAEHVKVMNKRVEELKGEATPKATGGDDAGEKTTPTKSDELATPAKADANADAKSSSF